MEDKKTGISIRMIRDYDPKADTWAPHQPPTMADRILTLACFDERDIPFMQKMLDAREFVKRQIH